MPAGVPAQSTLLWVFADRLIRVPADPDYGMVELPTGVKVDEHAFAVLLIGFTALRLRDQGILSLEMVPVPKAPSKPIKLFGRTIARLGDDTPEWWLRFRVLGAPPDPEALDLALLEALGPQKRSKLERATDVASFDPLFMFGGDSTPKHAPDGSGNLAEFLSGPRMPGWWVDRCRDEATAAGYVRMEGGPLRKHPVIDAAMHAALEPWFDQLRARWRQFGEAESQLQDVLIETCATLPRRGTRRSDSGFSWG